MECEKPVIAAINGAAIGAGCVLALCCDILIASENAYFAMTEVDVGLAGGVAHVRRFFRESDARLLIYTARRMTGPELYRMGVVSACVPADALLDTARGIAREIAAKSPLAVRAAKRSFNITENLAAARRLPFRAVADRGAGRERGNQGSAARLRREAQAGVQELEHVASSSNQLPHHVRSLFTLPWRGRVAASRKRGGGVG